MPYNCTSCDTIETISETIKTATITTAAVVGVTNFFLSASLNALFDIINMVQMYVHFPLFNIVFPGNLLTIGTIFIGIA